MVHEMLIDVTVVSSNKARSWSTPSRGVGIGTREIAGYAVTREEPDIYGATCPFHGVDTTTGVVEISTIVVRSFGFDVTAKTALAIRAGERAARTGMHSHLILRGGVDSFDDINLTAVGPVGLGQD